MRSKKNKYEIYKESMMLFVDNEIPENLFKKFLNDNTGESTLDMQCWLIENMKDTISDWCTGIGIIESIEHLYKTALENGNLSFENKI